MSTIFRSFHARLATGPNRIALSTALRGVIATATPLAVLPLLGLGASTDFAVIGALNTSMVDVGGPYRNRLAAMALNTAVSPLLVLAGTQVGEWWWLAAAIMLMVALGAGLIRALGPGGTSLGLVMGTAFLIGLQVAGSGAVALEWAAAYVGGGLWTILVALAFWQLRPYKRLEQELAGAWEAVARLVGAVRIGEKDGRSVVARRQRERRLARRHRLAREAIERAREALGEVRAETFGPGTMIAQLLVLLRAASRIAAAAVTFGELRTAEAAPGGEAAQVLAAAGEELEKACRSVAGLLLSGKGSVSFAPMRARLAELTALAEGIPRDGATRTRPLDGEILALAQAVRHLDNAEEAARLFFGTARRMSPLVLLPLRGSASADGLVTRLRAQITMKSAIFRHALRVAAAAAAGTAVIVRLQVPHGFWLPMTTLVVLQPEYGGTLSRALQRTAGTVGGAVLAGLLLATLHGTAAFEVAIAVLLFATFLLLRRRYGLAVTFLTPLIILLLGISGPDPWLDLRNRVADTVAGAVLAIVAGYALWPQWERERLPARLARAIRADKDYVVAVLDALAGAALPAATVAERRRDAEIETGNADAAFERMLAEPRAQRGSVGQGFALVTYVLRLCRHTVALAGHLDGNALPAADVARLRDLLADALEDMATALVDGHVPAPRPDFDAPLGRLRSVLTKGDGVGATIARLLGQIVSDTTSLHFAATMK